VLSYYHDNATVRTTDPLVQTVHIRRQHLGTAIDGDTVRVQLHASTPGKKIRGEVVAIIERSTHPIAGTIEFDGSFHYLIPDESRYHVDFLVAEKNLKGAKAGDKAVATFLRWEHANASPEVRIEEVLGQSGQPPVEFTAILKEFRLPPSFPSDVEREAAAHKPPSGKAPKGRLDIRKKLIITIDPVDARDFDDALSLETLPNGEVELGVHIADVSHYVPENSLVDKEALRRGTSTYLVHRVVPMLPENLSNDVCSLVPNQDRFAFSVFMRFSKTGLLKSYEISETLIRSSRRFTYEEAQQIIDGAGLKDQGASHDSVLPPANSQRLTSLVLDLHQLAQRLYKKRIKHGGIDFETQEVKYLLDEQMRPTKATVKTRTLATSLVEECMLAANRVVAEHMEKLKKTWRMPEPPPLVYRIHEEPDVAKLADAVGVIRALGIEVPGGKLTPVQINAVLASVSGKPERAVVNTLLLRAMAKAVYAEYNVGHYGLGFTAYAHFTSPIRRYPDLFVHRALKEYAKGAPEGTRWQRLYERASVVSDQSSVTERGAVEAERASQKLAQAMMARMHLAEKHGGYVTGVTNFGVFVTINELMCEGLLHIRDLGDDFYYFDEKRFRLVGRKTRRVLQFGTQLEVVIARVDMEKRMIDLQLPKEPAT
jgi:ribonuclease R